MLLDTPSDNHKSHLWVDSISSSAKENYRPKAFCRRCPVPA